MVAACVAMVRAFRYDLATTPKLLRISAPDHVAAHLADKLTREHPRQPVSATLAGLVAVRTIPIDTCEVHEKTGALTINDPVDPLAPDTDVVSEAELEEAEHRHRAAQHGSGHR
ncbi:hypothetical protein [Mycolicibacterium palauense]|uniref:hypothetical protein n=1 Tax=Mycolicibacterium palauense TaxID=2034511 RepID=UPI000BFEB6CA|nr:hypothetical protein [Mycolicibacterium palauense]